MSEPRTGKCVCGQVKIKAQAKSKSVGVCHCSTCRNWGGGPLFSIDCGADVTFEGEEQVQNFESSAWAERGFCKSCGTHLYYRLKGNGQYIMPAGLFEQQDMLFDHEVFVDEKPAYYDFVNQTKKMTGAEVFAQYGGT